MAATDRASDHCTDRGAREQAARARLLLGTRHGRPADRVGGVLATRSIIELKLLEALRCAGQGERARAGRHGRAAGQYGGSNDDRYTRAFH
jgi:hypothetical protein